METMRQLKEQGGREDGAGEGEELEKCRLMTVLRVQGSVPKVRGASSDTVQLLSSHYDSIM